jgi:hypothetical protein
MPVTHRPNRDGSTVTSRHVTYYLALDEARLVSVPLSPLQRSMLEALVPV